MTRHKTRLLVALCTVVVISVLSFERAGLLIAYRRLISDRSVKQKLRLLPKVSKLENSDDNSEVISLGYAEFHNTLGSIISTSMERFPKIDIDFSTCNMMFLPPNAYGPSLCKWREVQSEQHPEWYPKVSKKENAYLAGNYIDPYGFSKAVCATVPESLWKIALLPKSKLRRSVYNLKQKSITTGQHYFFEGGDIKGIYALGSTSDPEHSLLRIYDVRTRLGQYVLITHKNSREQVDAIEQLVASFRFTVDTPPDEELLYELVTEALVNVPTDPVGNNED